MTAASSASDARNPDGAGDGMGANVSVDPEGYFHDTQKTPKFRIHKTDALLFPWCMDYPEPREDGRVGIACSRFEYAVKEFINAVGGDR